MELPYRYRAIYLCTTRSTMLPNYKQKESPNPKNLRHNEWKGRLQRNKVRSRHGAIPVFDMFSLTFEGVSPGNIASSSRRDMLGHGEWTVLMWHCSLPVGQDPPSPRVSPSISISLPLLPPPPPPLLLLLLPPLSLLPLAGATLAPSSSRPPAHGTLRASDGDAGAGGSGDAGEPGGAATRAGRALTNQKEERADSAERRLRGLGLSIARMRERACGDVWAQR